MVRITDCSTLIGLLSRTGREAHVALGQAERSQGVGRDERVGDGLVEAAAGQGAPHGAPHLLRLGQRRRRCECRGSVSGARS